MPGEEHRGQPFTHSIVGCARCHGDGHEDLRFEPLDHSIMCWNETTGPVEVTHWALCPTNGQPILMAFVPRAIVCER